MLGRVDTAGLVENKFSHPIDSPFCARFVILGGGPCLEIRSLYSKNLGGWHFPIAQVNVKFQSANAAYKQNPVCQASGCLLLKVPVNARYMCLVKSCG